jgi:hypothetical protein
VVAHDATAGARGDHRGVTDSARRLNVEIELAAHSLRGTVVGNGRPPEPFDGWLALMSAVESRRPAGAAHSASSAEATPPEGDRGSRRR